MTLNEFVTNIGDLTDNAVLEKFSKLMKDIENRFQNDPETLRSYIEDGLLDSFLDFESNDFFGTEGLNL